MIKTYRKTATIQAEQFDGSQKMIRKYAHPVPKNVPEPSSNSWVTKNGLFEFHIGDWFISKPDGIYGPINNADFERDNTELPVIPKMVANYIKTAHSYDLSLFDFFRISFQSKKDIDSEWVCEHFELVARAFMDGWQAEEEK
ncbi:hypothetical protein MUDAN_BIHEEGNE_03139 [Lactiplantibacillus mudanjiangensis]|uniref:hypothetical protein n=1 Tax=Lactiplantibacillus mudanjiangensis TaxID=1296538 RepID=UPI001014AA2F|nr:hypothetical protein MUDAN_BIHEEGNE_03139 [Lactiplantibacillus mudanjiangensis]